MVRENDFELTLYPRLNITPCTLLSDTLYVVLLVHYNTLRRVNMILYRAQFINQSGKFTAVGDTFRVSANLSERSIGTVVVAAAAAVVVVVVV